MERREFIARGNHPQVVELFPGVTIRPFVNAQCGARNLATGSAALAPGARLPYHTHPCSEVITLMSGEMSVDVEGRRYNLRPLDAIHVPVGIAHSVFNPSTSQTGIAHTAFPDAAPSRDLVEDTFAVAERGFGVAQAGEPEFICRFNEQEVYPLADDTRFTDLFARRFGSVGICGGYGEFAPGTSLPCHVHEFDESISIITGEAICEVAGQRYTLSNCDTALVPEGRAHRFLNESSEMMAMIWVYAGDEPGRTLVDAGCCERGLALPEK